MILHILLLFSMFLLGGCLLLLFNAKLSRSEIIGLGFPVGSFLTTLAWFGLNWAFHIQISRTLGFMTIFFSAALMIITIKLGKVRLKFDWSAIMKASKITVCCWILIVAIFLTTAINNIFIPIFDWDALTLYDFRARVVTNTQSFFNQDVLDSYLVGYPYYTTLGHVTAYIFGSEAPKIWYTIVYASLIITFFGLLNRKVSTPVASMAALLLTFNPAFVGHAHMAYTNLSYVLFYGLSVIYFFSWLENNRVSDLVVFSILLAGSAWVRIAEPFHLVMAASLLLAIISYRRSWLAILSLVPVFVLRKVWETYQALGYADIIQITPTVVPSKITQYSELLLASIEPSRALDVLNFLYRTVLVNYLLLLPALALTLYIHYKNKRYTYIFAFLVLVGQFALIYVGTVYFSLNVPYWKTIPDSITRMSMFLWPLFYYLIFSSLQNKTTRNIKKTPI